MYIVHYYVLYVDNYHPCQCVDTAMPLICNLGYIVDVS